MAEVIKNYRIQQKQVDGSFLTLHPETKASLIIETEDYKVLTAAERTKLEGVSTGAQANIIEEIKLGETALTVTQKSVKIPVDTTLNKTSGNLLPNSVIATKFEELSTNISTNSTNISTNSRAIGTLTSLNTSDKSSVVAALNEINTTVKSHTEATAGHKAAIDENKENITTNTANIATLTTKVGTAEGNITNLQNNKVDKIEGKGLSTNDYTDDEKEKLKGIASGAEINVINSVAANVKSGSTVINGVVSEEGKARSIELDLSSLFNAKLDAAQKGAANGVATLDGEGKVPSSQLPSYVDDVVEGTRTTFPSTGSADKIYVDTETNRTYRWGGTQYVEISASLALGETASTAYAGDKGKKNAEDIAAHANLISTNTTNITANDTEIKNVKNSIGTATLATEQKTIKEAINELHTEINAISGTVASNETVTKLSNAVFNEDGSSKIAANAAEISGVKASIEGINTSITALQNKDTEISGNVNSLKGRVDTAETNINTISGKVTTLEGTVADHGAAIDGLEAADTAITGRLDKLETITGANEQKDKITVNTEAIAKNTAAIEALTSGDGKAKAAEVADKLATTVNVSVTGDVETTTSAQFNGTQDITLDVTLPDKVEAGTYTAVQVDAKGRVIAGAKDIIVGNNSTSTADLAIGGLFFREI